MDKYETEIRIKEIRNLYKSDDFASAAQLAKDIDWVKVKTWDPLAMMIDVYEQLGDNGNARDMAVLAYNRNLGGKRLVYRLTDILIKLGEMDDAKELYKEYCSLARNAADRHILNYHILRAEKAPDSELITALENFRDGEVDERYMYRLAQLYAKNGDTDKCINICDDIALWFKDGEYAQGAVKLKKRVGGDLTPAQEEIYKKSKVIEEELSKTQQITFADQLELNEEREIEIEDDAAPADAAVSEAAPAKAAGISSLLKRAFGTDDEDESEEADKGYEAEDEKDSFVPDSKQPEESADEEPKDKTLDNILAGIINDDDKTSEEKEEDIKDEAVEEKKEQEEKDIPWDFNNADEAVKIEEPEKTEEPEEIKSDESEEVKEEKEETDDAKDADDVKEVEEEKEVEEAKADDAKEPQDSEDEKDAEDTQLREDLTAGVMEILKEEDALRGEGAIDAEEQIEGQLNMEDWLNEVREQRYGKQNTKEYSRSELERMLDEKDEKSKAYDRLMQEQKRLANESGKPFDEAGAKQKVELQMITDAARTDLAIRTGKATAKLETENKYHHGEKSVEEKILKIMVDSVQEEVKKGTLKEAPEDRLKRFETAVAGAAVTPDGASVSTPEEFPKEVISAASVLVDFLTGNYNPEDVKKNNAIPTVLVNEISTREIEQEEPAIPKVEEPEAVLTEVEETPVQEPVKEDVQENVQEEKPETESDPVAEVESEVETAKEIEKEPDIKTDELPKEEQPFEDLPSEEGLFKRGKTEEITPEDIQAELQGEESAVAERITSADAAADAILQRITGKVPVITPEMEKELGIKSEDEEEKGDEKIVPPMEETEGSIEDEVEEHLNMHDDNFSDTAHIDKQTLREIIEATPEEDIKEEDVVKETTRIFGEDGSRNTVRLDEVLKNTEIPEAKREKVLAMFEEYYDFPEVNTRVEEIIAAFPTESAHPDATVGNIIITDNGEMDMTGLAKDLSKAFGMISSDKKYKLVKTSANALNSNGVSRVTSKLDGSVLVIEDATHMVPETVNDLLEYMKSDSSGTCIIMEDTIDKMNEFVSVNKELAKTFNHRIDMRDYTADELVEIAKELAGRQGYTIDEDGRLALYMMVKEINSGKEPLTLDELDDIIAGAAKRAKKRMKKNKELGDPVITNSDFR